MNLFQKETIYSVSELTQKVRHLLELEIGAIWVEGEISNHRLQSSGHQYFTLKDEKAQLSCVLFRGDAALSQTTLQDGQQIEAYGDFSVYEQRGQYQLIVRVVQPKGEGLLQAKFEALKKKLHAEGLFDEAHKKPLPSFPQTIGMITSPTGAALKDMVTILQRRAPWVSIYVYPVKVQGQGAYHEIAQGIQLLNTPQKLGIPPLDILVVARGGGSIEDLWNFNEEEVARAIYASTLPVISAVGHEIDFTIADFVADLRAPTPSAAAELAVPDGTTLKSRLQEISSTLHTHLKQRLDHHNQILRHIRGLEKEPQRLLREYIQRTDDLTLTLHESLSSDLKEREEVIKELYHRLVMLQPQTILDHLQQKLVPLREKIEKTCQEKWKQKKEKIHLLSELLTSLSPQKTFARGFSMTTSSSGKIITSATQVKEGEQITTHFSQDNMESTVAQKIKRSG